MTGLAGFDFQALNQKYLAQPANDAANYGVSIMRTKAANCWRCIGAYHLTSDQNLGRHNVFLECLDENGNRTQQPVINWTWALDAPIQTKRLDKPANEPAADIPIDRHATITLWVSDSIDSDSVGNLHARHATPGSGDAWGHSSFYIVFQRQSGIVIEPPPTEPPPLTLESVAQQTAAHEQRIAALERIVGDWTGGQ